MSFSCTDMYLKNDDSETIHLAVWKKWERDFLEFYITEREENLIETIPNFINPDILARWAWDSCSRFLICSFYTVWVTRSKSSIKCPKPHLSAIPFFLFQSIKQRKACTVFPNRHRKAFAGSPLLQNEYIPWVQTICLLITADPRGADVSSHFHLSLTVSPCCGVLPPLLLLVFIPHCFELVRLGSDIFKTVFQIKIRRGCLKFVDLP